MQFLLRVQPTLRHALTGAVLATVLFAGAVAHAADTPTPEVVGWQSPAAEAVESALLDWLLRSAVTDEQAAQRDLAARPAIQALYTDADRLDCVIDALVTALPEIASLRETCARSPNKVGSLEWLDSADIPYWLRANVRLYVGCASAALLLRTGPCRTRGRRPK